MEDGMEIPYKTSNKTAIWPSNPMPRHTPRENINLKIYMHLNVHSNTMYNSQDMEAT